MEVERVRADRPEDPFPIYPALVAQLAAHAENGTRDPIVAHVLATCAGYAAADLATVAMMMSRLGLGGSACVRVNQVVDAMLIFSTSYLIQSACGRVVVVCFRGTEPANFGNWLGDADVGPDTIELAGEGINVHAGFYRNLRATRFFVLDALRRAIRGQSLLDHAKQVEHPLEALYITGHSLGGAMAALFALGIAGSPDQRPIADRVRGVYTYGQPMVATSPLPQLAHLVGQGLHRHVMPRDLVPTLPPVARGTFAHFGKEYVYTKGAWCGAKEPSAQLAHVRDVSRAILGFASGAKRRASGRFKAAAHMSSRYISALRPAGLLTEFGDEA
jgi:lipase (class 3)